MTTVATLAPPVVRSVILDDASGLLGRLPDRAPVAWVRGGDGYVGWGEAARLEVSGAERFAVATAWWEHFCRSALVEDEVGLPGSGPVAFGSFAFADSPGRSVLVVPRLVVGRRDGVTWTTVVGDVPDLVAVDAPAPPLGVRYADGPVSAADWQAAVVEAASRVAAGELEKVVLARDLHVRADGPIDQRWLLARLAERYPECWTFAVDGLVGATPELLVERSGELVRSRVLAGTVRRGADAAEDERRAAELFDSAKQRAEHRPAVASVAEVLGAHCAELAVPAEPRVLRLANVLHLATDLSGRLADLSTALELTASLHPTAAVAGAPTDRALALIDELEGLDRGRYAGAVGWVDADGDGEWAIALRCAEVSGSRARLFAGCGIVADSDPEAELAEWQAKLVPVRDALGG